MRAEHANRSCPPVQTRMEGASPAARDGDTRAVAKVLAGTDGADTLKGGRGDDRIFGFDGKDKSSDVGAIRAERVGSGFDGAVFASSAPGDPDHLYVIRKDVGEIRILDPETGQSTLFLNIPDSQFTSGGEQGVLGLAFHPDYATNGRFFVYLTNEAGDIEIREYQHSPGSASADAGPVQTIITIPHPVERQPQWRHHRLRPERRHTSTSSIGDGGGGNDPANNAPEHRTCCSARSFGSTSTATILPGDPARNYAIPDDNPFVGKEGADEIWDLRPAQSLADQLRSAPAISISAMSARARARRSISSRRGATAAGTTAGTARGNVSAIRRPGSILPIFEYGRDLGTVVTGGEVYRGDGPALVGAYFFADFGSGRVWTLSGGKTTDRTAQIVGSGNAARVHLVLRARRQRQSLCRQHRRRHLPPRPAQSRR